MTFANLSFLRLWCKLKAGYNNTCCRFILLKLLRDDFNYLASFKHKQFKWKLHDSIDDDNLVPVGDRLFLWFLYNISSMDNDWPVQTGS